MRPWYLIARIWDATPPLAAVSQAVIALVTLTVLGNDFRCFVDVLRVE